MCVAAGDEARWKIWQEHHLLGVEVRQGYDIAHVDKTEAAVKDRLTKETIYWDHRAEEGRVSGAPTITVTRNEVLYSLNKPDGFILAIVELQDDDRHQVHYLRQPFRREPDFGVISVNYALAERLAQSNTPS